MASREISRTGSPTHDQSPGQRYRQQSGLHVPVHQLPQFAAGASVLPKPPHQAPAPKYPSRVAQPGETIDWKNDPTVKPPYSYATLISHAINSAADKRMTLTQIYSYVTANYAYFREAEPNGWQVLRYCRHQCLCLIMFTRIRFGTISP